MKTFFRYVFGTIWVLFVWFAVAVIVGLVMNLIFPPHDRLAMVGIGGDWRNIPGTILGALAAWQSWRTHVSRKKGPPSPKS